MKIESSPIGETRAGLMENHLYLVNLTLQLQNIKKGKEVQESIWCTRFRTEGHHKDNL